MTTKKKVNNKVAAKKLVVKKTKQPKVKKTTHVAIILDKSGSMGAIKLDTIGSFNEQIKSIKASANSDTFITLTLFDDEVIIHKFAESLDNLNELTESDYRPGGNTAMYDAIGMTVERMKKEIDNINDDNTAVLCVIITDGQENVSKTWHTEDISALVKGLTGTKRWTFSVLGANIDLAGLSDTLGIAKSNMAKFAATGKGIMRGTAVTAQSLGRYFDTRNNATDLHASTISMNFYSADSDEITDTTTEPDKK
jgi:hypothetical protein